MWAHTFSQCLGRDQADLPRARMHSPWFELLHARPGAPLRLRQERGTSAFSPGKGHHCVCARKGAPLRLRQERGTTAFAPGKGHHCVSALQVVPTAGVEVSNVDMANLAAVKAAILPGKTKLVRALLLHPPSYCMPAMLGRALLLHPPSYCMPAMLGRALLLRPLS